MKKKTPKSQTERKNIGTRYESNSAASAFWLIQHYGRAKAIPYVLYAVPDVQTGWNALAELPFMRIAFDSGNVITDRLAQYGSYEYECDGKRICEAFVAASDISHEEFVDSLKIFAAHGCELKEQCLPDEETVCEDETVSPVTPKVNESSGGAVYEIYSAENRASAVAYLRKRTVKESMYYVIVETPEGSFGRDKCGMFSI